MHISVYAQKKRFDENKRKKGACIIHSESNYIHSKTVFICAVHTQSEVPYYANAADSVLK